MLPKLEFIYNKEKGAIQLYASSKSFSRILLFLDVLNVIEDKYLFLDKLLNNQSSELSPSISNIGYIENEYSYTEILPHGIESEDFLKFVFCSTPSYPQPNLTTWIYKQANRYYLEITPNYPYEYRDPKPDERYISFEDFMKDYKPFYKETITRQDLQELRNLFAKATIETYKNMYYDAMHALSETEACRHMDVDDQDKRQKLM